MLNIWGSSKEIDLFKEKVASNFHPDVLQKKAVESGFYKRCSKLLPAKFFEIILYGASINGPCSLSHVSCEAAESFGITISKQAIDDRYDASAVAFIRSIFEEQVAKQIDGTINPDFLKSFNRVRIKDSTRFDLPKRLKDSFSGFGGKVTSEAALAIQYEFDVKNGKILDIDITSAKRTDYQDALEKAEDIMKGDLVVRDLGYFKTDVFKKIITAEGFLLSRLHSKIAVFEQNDKEISFSKLYKKMTRDKQSQKELQVFIGQKEKLPIRLIIDVVPEEVYQNRLIKAQKEAKKKGHMVGDEFKARARFNLMITNIPQDQLPCFQVYQLYKIRWQVELIFKTWKSTYGINKVHPMNYYRLMCFLYAKLILIIINSQIINLLQRWFYEMHDKLLSRTKCLNTLSNYFYKTRKELFNPAQRLFSFLQSVACLLSKNHWMENRKNRTNYSELFDLFIS